MTQQEKQRVRDMRRSGCAYPGIAAALRLSEATVKSFCRREKLLNKDLNLNPVTPLKDACRYCGTPMNKPAGMRQKSFCSDQCRYRWWNAHRKEKHSPLRLEHACAACGKRFYSYEPGRKYCSRECYFAIRNGGVAHEA